MKIMNRPWVFAGLIGMFGVCSLQASLQVTLLQDLNNYSDSASGGEFRAVVAGTPTSLGAYVNWSAYTAATADPSHTYFQTFCTEHSEHFIPGTQYTISSIGNNAMFNQSSGPGGIPINMGVAYLYSQFAAGTLLNYQYTYGSSRAASALNLQNAIWFLLGEGVGSLTGDALNALNAVTGSGKLFATSAAWLTAANGAFGVQDMVLGNPGDYQDQLIIAVPEASTMIAGAVLLLPLGASALRIVRKNRKA